MAERIYAPWVHDPDSKYAWLAEGWPTELRDFSWKLVRGEPAQQQFPDEFTFDLSVKKGIRLADSIPNILSIYVVSEKLKQILEQTGEPFEFLPVRIRNQKGRIEKASFYIANLLGSLDCVDAERSEYTMSKLWKDQVERMKRLVLEDEKIPEDKQIFRLGEMKQLIIVRKELAFEIFRTNECRGMIFQVMEEYGSEFR